MRTAEKLLFTAISLVLAGVGALAIVEQTHTGYSRYEGIRTLVGSDAIWFGKTCLMLAVLPLLVWIPKRWIATAGAAWFLALMTWLFAPLVLK